MLLSSSCSPPKWDDSSIPKPSSSSQEVHNLALSKDDLQLARSKRCKLEVALHRLEAPGIYVDYAVYASLLKQCGDAQALADGKRVHAHIVENGHGRNRFLTNHIIQMYGKCGSLEDARDVFDNMVRPNPHSYNILITAYAQNGYLQDARCIFEKMPELDVVSWNGMITAYAQNGHDSEALGLFQRMNLEGLQANKVTFISVLDACASARDLKEGRMLHGRVASCGLVTDVTVATALLNMYGKCGLPEEGKSIFAKVPEQNEVCWTAMISAYAQNGHLQEAQELFDRIPQWNVVASTAMVAGYAQYGHLETARNTFDTMPLRNVISWNAMIAAYAQNGHCKEALELFNLMDLEGIQPDAVSFVSSLHACTRLVSSAEGKIIHSNIEDRGLQSDLVVGNALVNFYVKCHDLQGALTVFNRMLRRDVVSWTAIIITYAQEGNVEEALQVLQAMDLEGVKPDEITIQIILSACSHAGLVADGVQHFKSLVADHSLKPELDHYLCMIDLLGRAGQLSDAEDLINNMPFEPDAVGWKTLLSAYGMQGKAQQGAQAADHLFKMEPQEEANASSYIMLSNMYKQHIPVLEVRTVTSSKPASTV